MVWTAKGPSGINKCDLEGNGRLRRGFRAIVVEPLPKPHWQARWMLEHNKFIWNGTTGRTLR